MGLEPVCESVYQKISPSEEDKRKVQELYTALIKQIKEEAANLKINVNPVLVGSIAKDTWIKTNRDIDIFIVFPRTYTSEEIGRLGLKIARKVTGEKGKEQYAEHPYLRAEIEDFQVDFVPCFEIGDATERISSVDRTPLHTTYIKKRLDESLKKEVRLLKQFLIGINAYGAEIKVGGFSGYLCELLIIYYSSFQAVLEACIKWKKQHIIDIEHYYPKEKEAKKIFSEPLIVIDPIDAERNVSAAVSSQKIAEFKAAAKAFLEEP
ncbi:MAG: CCA tRNA nucleotidyltransferase, partial [Candidatus Jordarchaeaceae archaeon]